MPTTSGTILALKSQRNATSTTAVPISPIMKIVNSCEGWKVGAWKLVSILRNAALAADVLPATAAPGR